MRIDPSITIAGIPSLQLRAFFQRAESALWGVEYLKDRLQLASRAKARRVLVVLVDLGYVECMDEAPTIDESRWRITEQALRFATATTAKPIHRATATKLVDAFLERVAKVNTSDRFLYRVQKVVIFGSFLTDQERINDIDLAVTLASKDTSPTRIDRELRHIQEAINNGRTFGTVGARATWPRNEVFLFLKARSRAISLHYGDEPILERTATKLLYEFTS